MQKMARSGKTGAEQRPRPGDYQGAKVESAAKKGVPPNPATMDGTSR